MAKKILGLLDTATTTNKLNKTIVQENATYQQTQRNLGEERGQEGWKTPKWMPIRAPHVRANLYDRNRMQRKATRPIRLENLSKEDHDTPEIKRGKRVQTKKKEERRERNKQCTTKERKTKTTK